MRIAQLVSNFFPTAAETGKGINSNAALLTDFLVKRNNDVVLYGSSESVTAAKLVSVFEGSTMRQEITDKFRKDLLSLLINKCYKDSDSFDIIHSHFTTSSSYYSNLVDTPTVQSIHSPFDEDAKKILNNFKNNNYISFSLAQRSQFPSLNWIANIYHGVDTFKFDFNPHPEKYLLFLGRITREKGAHLAIEAALASDLPLIIAGRSYPNEGYWHKEIENKIDGKKIRYVGEANFAQKIELLKNAKALLFPIDLAETFGLVMIEAMACGTPVIAFNKGSVSEVIKDKHTGFIVKNQHEMVKAISNLGKIDRESCRKRVTMFFSADRMVTNYEKVYLRIIEQYREKKYKKYS